MREHDGDHPHQEWALGQCTYMLVSLAVGFFDQVIPSLSKWRNLCAVAAFV
jgi:hypothetical protein